MAPEHLQVSFDSFHSALLTTFQCITLEGWSSVLSMVSRSAGPTAALYFIGLIVRQRAVKPYKRVGACLLPRAQLLPAPRR